MTLTIPLLSFMNDIARVASLDYVPTDRELFSFLVLDAFFSLI